MPRVAENDRDRHLTTSRTRPDIQGLRAIAVLAVIAFHVGLPMPGGFSGVDVFFVISGYVISSSAWRHRSESWRTWLSGFWIRRTRRLFPALALMLLICLPLVPLMIPPGGPQEASAVTSTAAVFSLANVAIFMLSFGYFGVEAHSNAFLNTWSLSVEEQLYLLFALLFVVTLRLGKRGLVFALSLLALLSFLSSLFSETLGQVTGFPGIFSFYSPVPRFWEFAAGALVFFVGLRAEMPKIWAIALSYLGFIMVFASFFVIHGSDHYPGPITLLPVAGTAVLLMAGAMEVKTSISRLLSSRAAQYVGDRSYSLYLWHWPFIVFVSFSLSASVPALITAVLVSTGPALLSFRYVESPIRYGITLASRRAVWIAGGTIALTLALSAGVVVGNSAAWGDARVKRDLGDLQTWPVGRAEGCDDGAPLSPEAELKCSRGTSHRKIYLVGDSNAGQLTNGLVEAAGYDMRVVAATTHGCPFGVLAPEWSQPNWCRLYNASSLQYLLGQNPSTIVIANSDQYWTGNEKLGVPGDATKNLTLSMSTLSSVVGELQGVGHQVVLVQAIPDWAPVAAPTSLRCSLVGTWLGRCEMELPEVYFRERQGRVRRELALMARSSDTAIVDTWSQMCLRKCRLRGEDGTLLYRDPSHLSVQGSNVLAPLWRGILSRQALSHGRTSI